jgi:hypothetical protein
MSKTPDASFTPLVAEGLRLIAEAEAITLERDAIAEKLKAKDAELQAVNEQLIALGAGRYRDAESHVATVVAAIEAKQQPDKYVLRSKEDEEKARDLAGEQFGKLFDRSVTFAPCEGFGAVAIKLLTPAKARDIIKLTLIPGVLAGGRRAHVRWK